MDGNQRISLGEAASRFLGGLPPGEAAVNQTVLHQFVRWFGRERCLDDLAAPEIDNYCGSISATDADSNKKLDVIRGFLVEAKKNGWAKSNLAVHVRVKKGKAGPVAGTVQCPQEKFALTRDGFDEMNRELDNLEKKKLETIDDIRWAAADKDFRENAPLHAAREQLGHIEGRIKELEETLKVATVIDDQPEVTPGAGIGDSVILTSLDTTEEVRYMIVSPKEVDPARGRISSSSPLGRAIVGRGRGEVIEIRVPAGTLRYRIEKIGR